MEETFWKGYQQDAGTVLKNRYEIIRTLGMGAFATTYLAQDRERNQNCVVKALSLRHVETYKAKELFEREARVLSRLNHPRIPEFIDLFTEESAGGAFVYLVQQYIEGKNLAQLVGEERKHFTEKEVVGIGIQIAEILEYLQSFSPPIIHRDIKPSNVLMTPDGKVYLIDFGAVRDKILHEPLLEGRAPTIVGTYGYMPMEQFEGQAVPASDMFSLGVVLLYLLSHKEPWEMEKDALRIDFAPHVRISKELEKILEQMILPDHQKRYQSASLLRENLESLLVEKVPTSKKPRIWVAIVAVLALILIGTGIYFSRDDSRSTTVVPTLGPELEIAEWELESVSVSDAVPQEPQLRLGSTQLRHGETVRVVAFSPDGKFAVSGSEDRTVSLWDRYTGQEVLRLEHPEAVTSVLFTADGRHLITSGGFRNTVWVWDLDAGKLVKRFQGATPSSTYGGYTFPIDLSPDQQYLASPGGEGAIQIWKLSTGETVKRIPGPAQKLESVVFSKDGSRIIACYRDGAFRVFDFPSGRVIVQKDFGRKHMKFVVSPDRMRVAFQNSGIVLVDASNGTEMSKIPSSNAGVFTFSPDGKRIAAATSASGLDIRIWDLDSKQEVAKISGMVSLPETIAFSSNGRTVASGSYDSAVRLWDVETGKELFEFPGHSAPVESIAFSPDGETLMSGSKDRTVRQWEVRTGREIQRRDWNSGISSIGFLSDGKALADNRVWDLNTQWEVHEFRVNATEATAISPDGRKVAFGEWDKISIRDIQSGEVELEIKDEMAKDTKGLAFSPRHKILISKQKDKDLAVWDVKTGRRIKVIEASGKYQTVSSFSPNGRFLIEGGVYAGLIEVREGVTFYKVAKIRGGGQACMSPDGKYMATRDFDDRRSILLYEVSVPPKEHAVFNRIATLNGHRGLVRDLVFSPNSRVLASSSSDGSVILWNLERIQRDAVEEPQQAVNSESSDVTPRKNDPPVVRFRFEGDLAGKGIVASYLSEEPEIWRFIQGKKGKAVELRQQVRLHDLKESLIGDSYTVQFWFRTGGMGANKGVQKVLQTGLISFDIRERAGYVFYYLRGGGHGHFSLEEYTGKVEPGRWYHVALVFDAVARKQLLYVDGNLVKIQPNAKLSDRLGPFEFGSYQYPDRDNFWAAIDELEIYDYPRRMDQIATDAMNPNPADLTKQ